MPVSPADCATMRALARPQVSLSAFAFLFSEFIQYSQSRVDTADQLQAKCATPRPPAAGRQTALPWRVRAG